MSANYLVDLGNTTLQLPSVVTNSGGGPFPASGATIGNTVDLLAANSYCNMQIVTGVAASGQLRVAVQTSDTNTSGTFTDPTSGLAQLPTGFQSGGLIFVNSGGANLFSGNMVSNAFQRPGRFARANLLSGDFFNGPITVGFVSQLKTTGSGGGFSFQPGSGSVSV